MAIAFSQCDPDETTVAAPWWAGAPIGPMEGWRGGRRRPDGAMQPRWEPDLKVLRVEMEVARDGFDLGPSPLPRGQRTEAVSS